VSFTWIKGHTGHIENELCDELATLAMRRSDLLLDAWYIEAPDKPKQVKISSVQTWFISEFELTWTDCKKCQNPLEKKHPKHTKKTLLKEYYYEYYHHCPACKTNYMLQEAKRDIKTLKI
jgi:ribonuclease HI